MNDFEINIFRELLRNIYGYLKLIKSYFDKIIREPPFDSINPSDSDLYYIKSSRSKSKLDNYTRECRLKHRCRFC